MNVDDGNPCTTDACDPVTGVYHTPVANGTVCNDGNACTVNDACSNGICSGTAVNCNDNNVCTVDSCNSVTGACTHTPVNVDDGNPCTTDSCDPVTGVHHTPVANGTACNDGNACTLNDACSNGVCSGTAVNCNDNNPCTTDSCDPQVGCLHTPIPNCGP